MNIFNRAVLLILAAILLVYGCAGAVVAAGGLATESAAGGSWLYLPLTPFAGLRGGSAAAGFAVCAVLILFALALLVAELVSGGPQGSALTVLDDSSGRVTLDRRVIRDLAQHEARTVFGVLDCWMDVRTVRGSLVLVGRLTVDRYANLLDVSRSVREQVKQSVERSLGQTVDEVQLRCAAGSPRRWPSIATVWSRLARNLETGHWESSAAARTSATDPASNIGDLLVQMHPLRLIERAGPVTASIAGTLAVILGVIVIAYPVVSAWAVGIGLILAGVGVLVTMFTLRAEEGANLASDGPLAHQQNMR